MADDQAPPAAESPEIVYSGPNLKYLAFIPSAVIKVTAYVVSLYELAKDSSGPLKPGVDSVEGTVKTVVGPVYQKVEGKPQEVLGYIDGKIDVAVVYLDGKLPPKVKEFGNQAYDAAKTVSTDVQTDGIYSTAKGYYERYEPVAESYGVQAYKKALTVPLVPEVVALTRYGALKVNQVIVTLKDHGIPLASYLPLLPVDYFDRLVQSDERTVEKTAEIQSD